MANLIKAVKKKYIRSLAKRVGKEHRETFTKKLANLRLENGKSFGHFKNNVRGLRAHIRDVSKEKLIGRDVKTAVVGGAIVGAVAARIIKKRKRKNGN